MVHIIYAICIGFIANSIICNSIHEPERDLTSGVLMLFILTAFLILNVSRR